MNTTQLTTFKDRPIEVTKLLHCMVNNTKDKLTQDQIEYLARKIEYEIIKVQREVVHIRNRVSYGIELVQQYDFAARAYLLILNGRIPLNGEFLSITEKETSLRDLCTKMSTRIIKVEEGDIATVAAKRKIKIKMLNIVKELYTSHEYRHMESSLNYVTKLFMTPTPLFDVYKFQHKHAHPDMLTIVSNSSYEDHLRAVFHDNNVYDDPSTQKINKDLVERYKNYILNFDVSKSIDELMSDLKI